MKRFLRGIAILAMAALMMGALASCSGADYAIKVGESIVSENDYKRNAATLRQNYLANTGDEDTKELWTAKSEDGSTLSDVFTEALQTQLVETKLYVEQFDALGLSLSAEDEQTIQEAVAQVVEAYGTMTEFNEALSKGYYTYDEFVAEYYDSAKKSKVLKHYFGEEGENPVSLKDIKAYYNVNNAYIKFIYITKTDPETEEYLTGDALKDARDRANAALEAAQRKSEKDLFPDLIEIHSDADLSAANGMVVNNSGAYNEKISEPAMALEMGEVALVETEEALMVIKRYDGTTDDVFTPAMQQQTLEEIRADEIAELLAQWKQDFKIKINQSMVKKYRPEKFVEE